MDQTTIDRALLGDPEAAKACTEAGVAIPCPFCGGTNLYIDGYEHGVGKRWRVVCLDCMAMVDPGTVQQKYRAIEAWNRRADLRGMVKEAPQQWIPVGERLPEVGKCVLVRQTYHAFIGDHGEYEGITVGYLHQPTDKRRMPCMPYFYYAAVSDYGDKVRAESICPGQEFVTHWMPLPQPPITGGDT